VPSISSSHFPQYVFRDYKKLLWNPVLKKAYVDLPEERVRLQLIEYLINEAGFPSSRISFETPVKLPRDKSSSRTDLICFDKEFKPLILAECKAQSIKIDEQTALQIGRYNSKIKAPFLLVSNGVDDFWFENGTADEVKRIKLPDFLNPVQSMNKDFEYWSKRGFMGKETDPDSGKWLEENLLKLFSEEEEVSYLKFDGSNPELFLDNYYRVYRYNEVTKLAISFTSTPSGSTKMNLIQNEKGQNVRIISIAIDLLAEKGTSDTNIYSKKGKQEIDIVADTGFTFEKDLFENIHHIIPLLN